MNSSDNPIIGNPLPISAVIPKDPEEMRNVLTLLYKRIANSVNSKETAIYTLAESFTSKQVFIVDNPQRFRQVYRKCFDMVDLNGANIPAGATRSFAHNITGISQSAIIYCNATATNGDRFTFVYPYVRLTATNVTITNPDAANALSQADVFADYMKES